MKYFQVVEYMLPQSNTNMTWDVPVQGIKRIYMVRDKKEMEKLFEHFFKLNQNSQTRKFTIEEVFVKNWVEHPELLQPVNSRLEDL